MYIMYIVYKCVQCIPEDLPPPPSHRVGVGTPDTEPYECVCVCAYSTISMNMLNDSVSAVCEGQANA